MGLWFEPQRDHCTRHSPMNTRSMQQTDRFTAEDRLRSLVQWGSGLRSRGHYSQSEALLKKALRTAEKAFGSDSREVAAVLNQLGMLGKCSGQFIAAQANYRRALSIVGDSYDHLTADLYHNLGGLEHARGSFDKAEPFARRAVELRERLVGRQHKKTAADIAALAAILCGQGRYTEAEPLFRRALAVFEHDRCENYDVAVNLNNLAALCYATGRGDEAERLYVRAIAIKENLFGPNHPDVALSLNNLAVFYRSRKRYECAARLYGRAIAIFEATLQPAHPKRTACDENYALAAEQRPMHAPLSRSLTSQELKNRRTYPFR